LLEPPVFPTRNAPLHEVFVFVTHRRSVRSDQPDVGNSEISFVEPEFDELARLRAGMLRVLPIVEAADQIDPGSVGVIETEHDAAIRQKVGPQAGRLPRPRHVDALFEAKLPEESLRRNTFRCFGLDVVDEGFISPDPHLVRNEVVVVSLEWPVAALQTMNFPRDRRFPIPP
jgi:hypothetical protein